MIAHYYNEIDPAAAQWLRNLIKAGLIPAGEVDERSIEDVRPSDIKGFTQAHFFAGIGGWPLALKLAGWPEDRPAWSGSCPCQPFSAAGKGNGFADERHLWPYWDYLIRECQPAVVFGEQVASKDGLAWLDVVQADLEAAGYASGALDICAAGIGAPHIRQRQWIVAERLADAGSIGRIGRPHTGGSLSQNPAERSQGTPDAERGGRTDGLGNTNVPRLEGHGRRHQTESGWLRALRSVAEASQLVGMADSDCARPLPGAQPGVHRRKEGARSWHGEPQRSGATGRMGESDSAGLQQRREGSEAARYGDPVDAAGSARGLADASEQRRPSNAGTLSEVSGGSLGAIAGGVHADEPAGPTNGIWRDADWLFCRDGKWRAVEPGTLPLAHGVSARVVRLRAYGNAINPYVAKEVIQAYMEYRP